MVYFYKNRKDIMSNKTILNKKSIFTMEDYEYAEPDTEYAFKKVQNLTIPSGFNNFNILMKELNED